MQSPPCKKASETSEKKVQHPSRLFSLSLSLSLFRSHSLTHSLTQARSPLATVVKATLSLRCISAGTSARSSTIISSSSVIDPRADARGALPLNDQKRKRSRTCPTSATGPCGWQQPTLSPAILRRVTADDMLACSSIPTSAAVP